MGNGFSCALIQNGTVRCWGWNEDYGNVGTGSRKDHHRPVRVRGLSQVEYIAAGALHACAVRKNGRLYCWGANMSGEVGDGTQKVRRVPYRVRGLGLVESVFLADQQTCAVLRSGAVRYSRCL